MKSGKKENRQKQRELIEKNRTTDLSLNISIITLNVNNVNTPIRRQTGRVDKRTWPNYILSIAGTNHGIKTRNVAKHPTMHKTALTSSTKNYWSKNLRGTKDEKSWTTVIKIVCYCQTDRRIDQQNKIQSRNRFIYIWLTDLNSAKVIQWEKKKSFQRMMLDQLYIYTGENKYQLFL